MRRSARFLVLAFAALLATACTRLVYMNVSLAYSNATPMLTWMVDDYVGLDTARKDWIAERIGRAMAWHRARELPRYRGFLAAVAERSSRPYTEEEVAQAWGDVRADYDRVVEHVLPDAAEFLAGLDERQLAHLEHRFVEDNERLVKESTKGTLEDRRAQAARRAASHIEEWVGGLSEAQRAIVYRREAVLAPMTEERLADRRYRQSELLALARTKDRERIAAGLRRLLLESDKWRRPEYVAKMHARDAAAFRMIAELSATLSDGQRAHLQDRIRDYIRDITQLAASD
jgi:hypothetical protein